MNNALDIRHSTPAELADPTALLLADKRSAATKRTYEGDLRDFFAGDPDPARVRAFLSLAPEEVALRLNQ